MVIFICCINYLLTFQKHPFLAKGFFYFEINMNVLSLFYTLLVRILCLLVEEFICTIRIGVKQTCKHFGFICVHHFCLKPCLLCI